MEADPLSIDEKVRYGACPEHNVGFLNSNYKLYADVSNRVVRTIQGMVLDVEAYSINKCWADLIGLLGVLGLDRKSLTRVHMPIGVGISSTRTLALVSIQTGQHELEERRYYRSLCIPLAHPIDYTRLLVQVVLAGLDPIYREGYAYSKCAGVLGSIVQTDEFTPDLFAPAWQGRPSERMRVVDRINARYGRAALHVGRVPADPGWQMRRELLSRGYMTRWGGVTAGWLDYAI